MIVQGKNRLNRARFIAARSSMNTRGRKAADFSGQWNTAASAHARRATTQPLASQTDTLGNICPAR
jgi:hypothetical protein